jgi:hypothetical protein
MSKATVQSTINTAQAQLQLTEAVLAQSGRRPFLRKNSTTANPAQT